MAWEGSPAWPLGAAAAGCPRLLLGVPSRALSLSQLLLQAPEATRAPQGSPPGLRSSGARLLRGRWLPDGQRAWTPLSSGRFALKTTWRTLCPPAVPAGMQARPLRAVGSSPAGPTQESGPVATTWAWLPGGLRAQDTMALWETVRRLPGPTRGPFPGAVTTPTCPSLCGAGTSGRAQGGGAASEQARVRRTRVGSPGNSESRCHQPWKRPAAVNPRVAPGRRLGRSVPVSPRVRTPARCAQRGCRAAWPAAFGWPWPVDCEPGAPGLSSAVTAAQGAGPPKVTAPPGPAASRSTNPALQRLLQPRGDMARACLRPRAPVGPAARIPLAVAPLLNFRSNPPQFLSSLGGVVPRAPLPKLAVGKSQSLGVCFPGN